MRITLAFVNLGTGHGLVRASVNDEKPVTVGRYERDGNGKKWTASLYATPGKRSAIAGEISSVSVPGLRNAVQRRLAKGGAWWQ